MANKNLFSTISSNVPFTDIVNSAGGEAYSLSSKGALAQYAMTGCFNGTYYVTAEKQLESLLKLASKVDSEFIAKLAIYSRQKGVMKDMPAILAAIVANKDSALLSKIFSRVVDNPKMLRNFVQIVRSGATGRKSLGTRPKKLIQNYLNSLSDQQLFFADIGNSPSLQDILKMVHPKPSSKERNALYAYLLGKEYSKEDILPLVNNFEFFKKNLDSEIPNVPFQLLTSLPLNNKHWESIAGNATWNQIRMNLNTFSRHGVFSNTELTKKIANKLCDKEQVLASKAFPYQLYAAYLNVNDDVPIVIKNALQDAAEHSLENIPEFDGKVYIMLDTSGSMSSPISGNRGSVTSKINCIDVAALFASAILRKNPEAEVIPFDTKAHVSSKINSRDSIMTNAKILSGFGGGGTDCSAPLVYLNSKKAKGDVVIYLSDNESWYRSSNYYRGTATMEQWEIFKKNNKDAKLVNIDIQPTVTTQVANRNDILNIGGFNDSCFDVIQSFIKVGNNQDLWIKEIESVRI